MADLCWFCQTRPSAQSYVVIMSKVLRTERGMMGTTTRYTKTFYQKDEVFVPRCLECASAHDRAEQYGKTGMIAGVILGIALAVGFGPRLGGNSLMGLTLIGTCIAFPLWAAGGRWAC